MEINGATSASASSTATTASRFGGITAEEGKESFLQLLVAQLQHQDPLSPMDNTTFVSELAQFSSLEKAEAMNANLETLVSQQERNSGIQASALIGKTAQAAGNNVHLHYGESETLYYRLGAQSEGVTITIFNDSGNLVQTLKKAGQAAGEQSLTWNGKNSNGERLPEGDYTFRVEAADKIGNPITTETFISGVIEGVGYNNNNAHLVISGNQVPFTSLISVTNN